jgi:hypothetical protein
MERRELGAKLSGDRRDGMAIEVVAKPQQD